MDRNHRSEDIGVAARAMPFSVVDIPFATTPEEAAMLLNDSHLPGFRVVSVVPWPGVGVRVFRRNTVGAYKGRRRNRDGKEDQAIALIQANPAMAARNLVGVLRDHGIQRGKDWVLARRGIYAKP